MTTPQQANRRYHMRFWPPMIVYAALCFAVPEVIQRLAPPTPVVWVLAALPGLMIGFVILAMGRFIIETDEFTRMVHVRAGMIALGLTMFIATTWGFLEIYAEAPDMPLFLVLPLYFFIYGPATALVRRRYG